MRLQNIISLVFILLFLQNCVRKPKQSLTCRDFNFGKFELKNINDNRKYIITRNQNFQIEEVYNLATNEKIKNDRYYIITWKNDCEYQLKMDTLKSEYDNFDLQVNSLGGLKNRILKIEGKCAEIETSLENQTSISKICRQ